jgi:hypothetical protein
VGEHPWWLEPYADGKALMPYVVRCKLCGKDHPYSKYADIGSAPKGRLPACENEECEAELSTDNIRIMNVLRSAAPADPLEEM